MNRKKIIRVALIVGLVGALSAAIVFAYVFFTPHRDVQSVRTDYQVTASKLVAEYLENSALANDRYLDEEGESKVFEVSGQVASITEDFNGQKVVLLKSATDKAGVSCTFLTTNSSQVESLTIGSKITVKGVITAGASYDEDLELFEHVLLDQCALVSK
jgi:hypothetical protein